LLRRKENPPQDVIPGKLATASATRNPGLHQSANSLRNLILLKQNRNRNVDPKTESEYRAVDDLFMMIE
jgi:hypothetical protein